MRHRLQIPNIRNLGVIFRILMLINSVLLLLAAVNSTTLREFMDLIMAYSGITQPILLLSLLLLFFCQQMLNQLRYSQGILAMWAIVLLSCFAVMYFFSAIFFVANFPSYTRVLFLSSLLFLLTLYYFYLTGKAYSPALEEAKLQALQARIRPHFLFNSINAVLSLIRSHPKQAETALEDMADLFRVFMADNRDLVPLAQEIALCRQYCALEKLRLEERLNLVWQIDAQALGAMIPPLVLQPLLENAVYHGIEPMAQGGTIIIKIACEGNRLHMTLTNPLTEKAQQHQGNKMAINNIKERLNLHFDLEATLQIKRTDQEYQVHIMIPYTGI